MYVCMHVWVHMYACIYACLHACVPSFSLHVSVPIHGVTEQIWLPHCKYEPQSHYAIWAYRPNIFAYVCYNASNCNNYFTHNCHVWANNKYASQMPHIWNMSVSSCAPVTQLSQYINLIWSQCNQQYDQEQWSTYISHYWHMPLNKHACHMAHMSHCATTLVYV